MSKSWRLGSGIAWGVIGLCGVVTAWAPGHARAYRTFADDPEVGEAARQPTAEISWDIVAPDMSLDRAEIIEAASLAAFEGWSSVPCAGIRPQFLGAPRIPASHEDGRNTLTFVDRDWEATGLPVDRPATTDVRLSNQDGAWVIAEADIYVDISDRWGWTELGGPDGALSLRAVLTHEVGHLLGLLHPCESDATPQCTADPSFLSSVMHPVYGMPMSLSADDVSGICALYPASGSCECTATETCVEGHCLPMCEVNPASCLSSCSEDAECAGGACAIAGPHERTCVADGERGANCARGADCASRRCVSPPHGLAYCTETCRGDLDCAPDERCSELEGMMVCAPPAHTLSGCAASVVPGQRRALLPASLAMVACVLMIRSRKGWSPR